VKLLHISSTPRGLSSNTVRASNILLETLLDKYDNLTVKTLDLFKADLPSVAGSNIESKYMLMTGQNLDESAQGSWRQIEKNIEQFLEADVYLLTVPMWNFGIPYVLKYYIDAIVQPGYLFRYNEQGYSEGLVKGKKMICVTSRGADYSSGPLQAFDFVESYLRPFLGSWVSPTFSFSMSSQWMSRLILAKPPTKKPLARFVNMWKVIIGK